MAFHFRRGEKKRKERERKKEGKEVKCDEKWGRGEREGKRVKGEGKG